MIALESERMESVIEEIERSSGSPDGVPQTWTPELHQSFAAAGGGLWSPYRQSRLQLRNEHGSSNILRPHAMRESGCYDYRGARQPQHNNIDAFEFMGAPTMEHNYVAVPSMECSYDAASMMEHRYCATPTMERSDGTAPMTEPSFSMVGGNGRVITRSMNTPAPSKVLQPAPTAPLQIEIGRRRRQTGTWTDNQMAAAVAAMDAGCRLATAARNMEIPATSLRDHIYGRTIKQKKDGKGF